MLIPVCYIQKFVHEIYLSENTRKFFVFSLLHEIWVDTFEKFSNEAFQKWFLFWGDINRGSLGLKIFFQMNTLCHVILEKSIILLKILLKCFYNSIIKKYFGVSFP